MYKKEHEKYNMKKSINPFSLLDDDENINKVSNNNVSNNLEKMFERVQRVPEKFKKPVFDNNKEDKMFSEYYGRKTIKTEKKYKNVLDDDGFKSVVKKKEQQIIKCSFKNLE